MAVKEGYVDQDEIFSFDQCRETRVNAELMLFVTI